MHTNYNGVDTFIEDANSLVVEWMQEDYPPEVSKPALEYHNRGGKGMRPMLTYIFGKGYGCPYRKAVEVAAITEIGHICLLIKDDIEDAAETRRGAPALHRMYGLPIANNAADALLAEAYARVWQLDNDRVSDLFYDVAIQTAYGQGLDLSWSSMGRWDVSEKEHRGMLEQKTSYYSVVFPVVAAAHLSLSTNTEETKRLEDFSLRLGVAFQLIDDLKPFLGDKDGKDPLSDIKERKRTLAVILADKLLKEKGDLDRLHTLFGGSSSGEPMPAAMAAEAMMLIEKSGAPRVVASKVKGEFQDLLDVANKLSLNGGDKEVSEMFSTMLEFIAAPLGGTGMERLSEFLNSSQHHGVVGAP